MSEGKLESAVATWIECVQGVVRESLHSSLKPALRSWLGDATSNALRFLAASKRDVSPPNAGNQRNLALTGILVHCSFELIQRVKSIPYTW